MGRFDTRLYRPPVRLAAAMAAGQMAGLELGSEPVGSGAGQFGEREARFGSVPIRLRIDRAAGPNNAPGLQGAIPINHTQRKQGFPQPTAPAEGEPTGGG